MRNAGFSLIELMVATVLVGILMIFTMQIFTVNNRAYVKTDSVVDTQQSVRVISSTLERDLRHAGMMIPEGAAVCGIDDDAGPDRIYISDYTAINPTAAKGTFDGAEIQNAITNVSTGGPNWLQLGSLTIEPGTGDPAYDTDGNGTNDSDFQEGGGVIVVDLLALDRGSACGRVEDVNIGGEQINVFIVSDDLDTASGITNLRAVPAIEYRITGGELYRNGLKLAESIEDLQLAYFMDINGDNLIDTDEMRGDGIDDDYVAQDNNAADLREVRFNIVVRTRSQDERFTEGYFQALENRDDPGAGRDGFRRRVHTNTVRLRNVGDRVQDPV